MDSLPFTHSKRHWVHLKNSKFCMKINFCKQCPKLQWIFSGRGMTDSQPSTHSKLHFSSESTSKVPSSACKTHKTCLNRLPCDLRCKFKYRQPLLQTFQPISPRMKFRLISSRSREVHFKKKKRIGGHDRLFRCSIRDVQVFPKCNLSVSFFYVQHMLFRKNNISLDWAQVDFSLD